MTAPAVRVAFIVNGDPDGAMAARAKAFAARVASKDVHVEIAYRSGYKVRAIPSLAQFLVRTRPDVTVVFDIGYSGVAATLVALPRRGRLIIDTGDDVCALARSMGRSGLGLAATYVLEQTALRAADAIVVRGTYHREALAVRGYDATVIQDGVDCDAIFPADGTEVRRRYGVAPHEMTVGLVGTSVWSERLGIAYGWELVEALAHLRHVPVRGLFIGRGDGVARIRARAIELGVADRLVFTGPVFGDALREHLAAIDICLSTQTDDAVGWARTTGKLPLYLAAGRFVLASDVGEAHRVLPAAMRLPYRGTIDRRYPERIAERVHEIATDRSILEMGLSNVGIARKHFDYNVLAVKYDRVIRDAARIA